MSSGQSHGGGDHPIETETHLGDRAAHLQMDVAGAGGFALLDQLLDEFWRGRGRIRGLRPGIRLGIAHFNRLDMA